MWNVNCSIVAGDVLDLVTSQSFSAWPEEEKMFVVFTSRPFCKNDCMLTLYYEVLPLDLVELFSEAYYAASQFSLAFSPFVSTQISV